MEQIYNPYLSLTEYIPDGEPRVFGDRLYIYGSHDRAGGEMYCLEDYEVWSASVDNLKSWRSEGTSYKKTNDPSNKEGGMNTWAPDAVQGPDGRYYLFYCLSFYPEIGVAVSDRPEGPFEFYGHVHYPEHIMGGKTVQEGMVFDPAVLVDDDKRVFLYYGFCPACEREIHLPEFTDEELAAMPEGDREQFTAMKYIVFGEYSMVVELEADMLTAKEEPRNLIPGGHHTDGTGFEGHGFFEASSIRKVNGKYYFVYSSHKSHELCYAVSDKPDRDFVYGGTIISNGDIGLDGRDKPVYPMSNNHGGIVKVKDDFYIFYQRPTNGTEFSRQGCAEKIQILEDGSIPQVEITSMGLNGEPLKASGTYPAGICCHLTDPTVINHIDYNDPIMQSQVCITEENHQSFITKIKNDTTVGYKYFDFEGEGLIAVELKGSFSGKAAVSHDEAGERIIGHISVDVKGNTWKNFRIPCDFGIGKKALYFHFTGEGSLSFKSLAFIY